MIADETEKKIAQSEESVLVSLSGRREVILGIIIVLIAIAMPFLNRHFLSYSNLGVLLIGSVHYTFMAIGICLLLVMGEIDLSIGSSMAMAGTIVALGMKYWGINIPLSILFALLTTVLIGFVNGLLVVKVGINFLITTLATMGIVRGLVVILAEGGVAFLPEGFNALGQTKILGLQSPVWVMFVMVIIVGLLLAKQKFFRHMYYIGGNLKAARLIGIPTDRVRIITYMISGFMAGLAGVLNAARFGSASSTTGTGAEMIVISATVLGGCSLSGGQGNMFGVFLGVIFITLLSNVLVMLNVSTYWHQPVNGFVLIGALSFDILMNRWRMEQQRKRVLLS
jgi:ribose transport system permease protein